MILWRTDGIYAKSSNYYLVERFHDYGHVHVMPIREDPKYTVPASIFEANQDSDNTIRV